MSDLFQQTFNELCDMVTSIEDIEQKLCVIRKYIEDIGAQMVAKEFDKYFPGIKKHLKL